MDPVEDDQLPDDEDDAWQVEQDEEEDNGQQCGQLLMLIISRWEVFLYRIFVDETEESDVGEAHHNDRQYCPKRLRKSEDSQQLYFIVLPKKRIDDRKVDEPVVEICSYEEKLWFFRKILRTFVEIFIDIISFFINQEFEEVRETEQSTQGWKLKIILTEEEHSSTFLLPSKLAK